MDVSDEATPSESERRKLEAILSRVRQIASEFGTCCAHQAIRMLLKSVQPQPQLQSQAQPQTATAAAADSKTASPEKQQQHQQQPQQTKEQRAGFAQLQAILTRALAACEAAIAASALHASPAKVSSSSSSSNAVERASKPSRPLLMLSLSACLSAFGACDEQAAEAVASLTVSASLLSDQAVLDSGQFSPRLLALLGLLIATHEASPNQPLHGLLRSACPACLKRLAD